MTHELRGKIQSVVMRSYPDLQRHLKLVGTPLTESQAMVVMQHEQALIETALNIFREAVRSQKVGDHELADLFENTVPPPHRELADLFERIGS